jgi:hypothetical protein
LCSCYQEEYKAYTKLKELFSPEMVKHLIIVFNGMDELGDTIGKVYLHHDFDNYVCRQNVRGYLLLNTVVIVVIGH